MYPITGMLLKIYMCVCIEVVNTSGRTIMQTIDKATVDDL